MRETRTIRSLRLYSCFRIYTGVEHNCPRPRYQQKIEHVAHSGPAQMRMTEAHQRGVVVMVAGGPVPIANACVRAQLHCPEWHRCSRKTVPVTARTNEHVYISRKVFRSAVR